jgi:hypothetical protein
MLPMIELGGQTSGFLAQNVGKWIVNKDSWFFQFNYGMGVLKFILSVFWPVHCLRKNQPVNRPPILLSTTFGHSSKLGCLIPNFKPSQNTKEGV